MNVLCFIQTEDGALNGVSKEALSLCQEICQKSDGDLTILSFDSSTSETLSKFKASKLITLDLPELKNYNPLYYTAAVNQVMTQNSYDLLILGHTYQARDWVPRLSARLDIPFVSDCIGYSFENGDLDWIRSLYRAKVNCKIKSKSAQTIISVQSGCFSAENLKEGSCDTLDIDVNLDNVIKTITPGEKFKESGSQVDLNSTDVIVSIGRGIAKEENIPMADELSKSLGGLLASSRPVVDSGWLDHSLQIGSSGQVVSPKLYLALGLSGAIQHTVGMKGSKSIIAINKDPNAPIFELSDYGVVGDILEIIPKLNEAVKNS